jgi:hypothetical protein
MAQLLRMASAARCLGGLWGYLIARDRGRIAIELEHERNKATQTAIQALPAGAELMEYELGGRLRVIRIPAADPRSVVAADIRSLPGGELSR